jgi:hypothetical protein
MLPFFEGYEVRAPRTLTDRGSEYCGNLERREYELQLAIEDIDHSRHQDQEPANERHLRALQQDRAQEFYRVACRATVGSFQWTCMPLLHAAAPLLQERRRNANGFAATSSSRNWAALAGVLARLMGVRGGRPDRGIGLRGHKGVPSDVSLSQAPTK